METFLSTKVIDPHKNMPFEVMEAFFEGTENWQMDNMSFTFWNVNTYDYSHPDDAKLKFVDDWIKANFPEEKQVIILRWW